MPSSKEHHDVYSLDDLFDLAIEPGMRERMSEIERMISLLAKEVRQYIPGYSSTMISPGVVDGREEFVRYELGEIARLKREKRSIHNRVDTRVREWLTSGMYVATGLDPDGPFYQGATPIDAAHFARAIFLHGKNEIKIGDRKVISLEFVRGRSQSLRSRPSENEIEKAPSDKYTFDSFKPIFVAEINAMELQKIEMNQDDICEHFKKIYGDRVARAMLRQLYNEFAEGIKPKPGRKKKSNR